MSAYFATPVLVRVVDQREDDEGRYGRRTELYRKDTGVVVCRASAALEVDRPNVRELIEACVHGLGQLLTLLDVPAIFELVDVGDDGLLWRTYRLWGEGFSFAITEQFVTEAFPGLLSSGEGPG